MVKTPAKCCTPIRSAIIRPRPRGHCEIVHSHTAQRICGCALLSECRKRQPADYVGHNKSFQGVKNMFETPEDRPSLVKNFTEQGGFALRARASECYNPARHFARKGTCHGRDDYSFRDY